MLRKEFKMLGDLQVDIAHAVIFAPEVTIVIVLHATYSTDTTQISIANVSR